MPTFRELLLTELRVNIQVVQTSFSVSATPAAEQYNPINPTEDRINLLQNIHSIQDRDVWGDESPFALAMLATNHPDWLSGYRNFTHIVCNEGEAGDLFTALVHAIRSRFGNVLVPRREVGPAVPTSTFAATVDRRFDFLSRTISIAELKAPGYLAYAKFNQHSQPLSTTKQRLGKKWRWYCRHYGVYHMVAFDGQLAMAIVLEAQSAGAQDFKICRARLILAPANQCSYLIFKVLEMGVNRVLGEMYGHTPMILDGWDRTHEYYSGTPLWRQGNQVRPEHPDGWIRKFGRGQGLHYWEKVGSQPRWEVLDGQARAQLRHLFA